MALVPKVVLAPGVSLGAPVRYRIRMVSEPSLVDTSISAPAADTVILRLPVATYRINVENLPARCSVRDGPSREVLLPEKDVTAIVRLSLECRLSLRLRTFTEGYMADDAYVYRVVGSGIDRAGTLGGTDTARIDALPPGDYGVQLSHVATHCVVTSDGGVLPRVRVPAEGGADVEIHVECANPDRRPRIVRMRGSWRAGVAALVFTATDPNRDIERYLWGLTDCNGRWILSGGPRLRLGLRNGAVGPDTISVTAAYELGLPDDSVAAACASLRVVDSEGNSSGIVERRLIPDAGSAPEASLFNAVFSGQAILRTTLGAVDADGDYAGVFVGLRYRDGALGRGFDGKPDYAILNTAGFPGVAIPDVVLGGLRPPFHDYVSVIVYLIDRAGHLTRLEDSDLFR